MNKKIERREKIISYLKTNNASGIKEMSEMLKVSPMTIRRDLEILAKQNIIRFIHGGVIYNPNHQEGISVPTDYLMQRQKMLHREEKTLIAKQATSIINSHETIMLDSGTTTYYLARELEKQELTVISWSLNIIEELIRKPQNHMLVQGGIYHSETQMFENHHGMETIRTTRASKAFISAGGVHSQLGITCPYHYEVETKRAAIKSSMTNILLIDSSKFGKVCTAHMAEINEFDLIITDSGIPTHYKEFIENTGVELIIV